MSHATSPPPSGAEIPQQARPQRWPWLLALPLTIAAGLASRTWPLPGLFAEHTGDALYAVAVFCLLGLLWPRRSIGFHSDTAWVISVAVEASQLLSWPWLVELRATRLGGLLLGHGFQWADVLAYTAGSLGAFALATWLQKAVAGTTAADPSPPTAPD